MEVVFCRTGIAKSFAGFFMVTFIMRFLINAALV
jgi:hypothetical protein